MSPERVCVLEKSPAGYGFHLHSEKGRPGQFVRLVEAGSTAERAGLRAGDRLIRVCGEDVRELGHQQVVGKIRAAEGRLTLEVQGPEAEEGPRAGEEEAGVPEKELRPRLCSMKKGPSGYGFNLHSDKSHPGQYVRAVDPDSPAERAGLLPKDRIIEVNGVCMEGMQHADMVSTIKSGGDETSLLVVDPETDAFFQECDVTPGRQHLTGPLPKRVANGDLEKVSKPDEGLESEGLQESPLSSPEPVTPRLDERQEMPESPPVPVSATMLAADPLLDLNMSLALAKERAHQKRSQKKAPAMDWSKKNQVFSSL